MPIYEYKCGKCGVFEITQRITENPLKKCPTCKSKVERIISATSFVLKGTGWYATDYAKAGAPKTDANPESKSESKSDTKSESKAESSTDSTKSSTSKESSGNGATTAAKSTGSAKPSADKSASKSSD